MKLNSTKFIFTLLISIFILFGQTVWANVYYVNDNAAGANDGTTWDNAYTDLQSALGTAGTGDEIWVAAGTYKPDGGTADRTLSFVLKGGVKLYGGFPNGLTGLGNFSDRNGSSTILSGNLDNVNFSYHILFADGASPNPPIQDLIIDGFTIQDGNADGTGGADTDKGAAFFSNEAEVTFNNCTFQNNNATTNGGAIYTTQTNGANGKLILKKCTFTSNNVTAIGSGGAIYTEGLTQSAIISCQFYDNNASGGTGSNGGAIFYRDGNNHQIVNGLFYGNGTSENGGAIYANTGVGLEIINTTISENTAGNTGDGIYLTGGTLNIKNSILWNNDGTSEANQLNTNATITLNIDHTILQGGSSAAFSNGIDNLDQDPLFVGNPDFSLQSGSPAIDAGSIGHLPTDAFDIDEDGNIGENLPDDLAGNDRLGNSIPDMGAYEATPHIPITIYVNNNPLNSTNDGTTWDDAFTDLQSALTLALDGDEIWVAEGEYFPDGGTADRTLSFIIPKGVKLYGGFADAVAINANNGNFSQRNAIPSDSPTILSGAIGGVTDTDNSFHIITIQFNDMILDGFIIEKGNTTGASSEKGGGMLIQGSTLEVFNCIFRNNFATNAGAAISMSVDSNLDLKDCHFENNTSNGIGGAINNDQNLRIYASTFENNIATDRGGAIYNASNLEIYDSEFQSNQTTAANSRAGAIYNTASLEIYNSEFENNSTTAAPSYGGAIYNATGSFTSNGNNFNTNTANTEGGAIYSGSGASILTIDNNLFTHNSLSSSTGTGAALRVEGDLTLTSSTFIDNNTRNGGAIYTRGSAGDAANIDRCIFRENGTVYGAIYVDGNITANISNSLFDGNSGAIGNSGSAISAWGSSTTNITNCTFVNQSGSVPSVVRSQDVNINIANSIFWNNANASLSENTSGDLTIDYSLVPETTAANLGISNVPTNMIFATNPIFRNPNIEDYRLKSDPNSPSIDKGTNAITAVYDLDGFVRPKDIAGVPNTVMVGTVDLGAYETQDEPFTNGTDNIIYVNQNIATSGDGKSWNTPFKTLQEALGVAYSGRQIWVAEGTYYPAGADNADRSFSFNLVEGVKMYGGFPNNLTGTGSFTDRNISSFPTILSGDIGAAAVDADNSYHVLIADGLGVASVLDGFIIEDGNADGGADDNQGGGIRLESSDDFTIQNCIFRDNFANDGGAVYIDTCDPNFFNVLLHNNLAQASGGAFFLDSSSPVLTNCTIVENDVDNGGSNGAGIYSQNSSMPEIYNTIIFDNTSGGAENLHFQFHDTDDSFIISNSMVEDWGGGTPTGSYINALILNTEPDLDVNFKISTGTSPALDAGSNSFLPLDTYDTNGDGDISQTMPIDLANLARVQGTQVDIGAFESAFALDLYEVKNTSSNPNVVNSLPWVVNNVNISNGGETVTFDIPNTDSGHNSGTGQWTISLTSPLVINQNAIFDATTQPSWTSTPVIKIDGTSSVGILFDLSNSSASSSEFYGFELSNSTNAAINLLGVDDCIIGSVAKMNVFNDDNNDDIGLLLNGANNNLVEGNRFGTDVTGTSPQGNLIGIFLEGNSNNNLISKNTIAHNAEGIHFRNAGNTQGNYITQNSIHDNGTIGIDLNDDAVQTSNDAGDTDGGTNLGQNYPQLSTATANANQLTIAYDLSSFASGTYGLEFFLSDGNGQGETYLAVASSVSEASTTFTITSASAFLPNQTLVATATDANGNTSEFSNEIPINVEPPLLGIAKEVNVVLDNVANPNVFNVTYTILARAYGNVDLSIIRLQDDLSATFAAGATFTAPTALTSSISSLVINSNFDGNTDTQLLTSGALLANTSGTIQFTLQVATTDPSDAEFFNSVTGQAQNVAGMTTNVNSNEGTDPDAFNSDDIPNQTPDEEVPTRTLLENPNLSLSKSVGTPVSTGFGTFDIPYTLSLHNTGNVNLQNVQVTDNLNNTFGTALVSVSTPVLGTGLTANAITYNGNGNNDLLNSSLSTLAAGATETITFTVSVDLTGSTQSSFNNTASASGDTPSLTNGIGAADMVSVTIENPVLGISKEAGTPTSTGFGTFDIPYTITVQNYGNVSLSNVQVTDNLATTFAGATSFILSGTVTTSNSNLIPNAAFDGNSDTNLLNISTLAVSGIETIDFTVHVDLNGSTTSSFANFAIATGSSPNGTGTNDISTDGTNPDPNSDNNPDENILTPVTLENPVLGVSKEVLSQTNFGNGEFDVHYQVHVENLGNVDLSNVQVTDNLATTFAGATSFILSGTVTTSNSNLIPNAAFDGNSDTNLLNTSILAVSGTETIDFTVHLNLNGSTTSSFANFAIATGSSPNGTGTNDISTDGTNPDPNSDNNPDEQIPTPVTLENPILGIAKEAGTPTSTGFGTFDIPYTITVQNYGNVPIESIRLTDDLNAAFGLGLATFTVSNLTAPTGFAENAAFNGNSAINLLTSGTLAIGANAAITFTVQLNLNGDNSISIFNNFAIATGSSPNGTGTNDISTNGTNPDPNSDNNPDENILTPVTIENPVLGLAKELISQTTLGANQFDIAYRIHLENLGNVALQSLQVEDNLFNTFTGTTVLGIQSLSVSTASLVLNVTPFDGVSNTNILESSVSNLPIGQSAFIDFTVRVDIGSISQATFDNFAIATATSPNGIGASDISTNGNNPDPNSDFNPDENEITPVTLINSINPPFNLRASSQSAGRIELTWQENANNELGFKIERSDDGGATFVLLDSVGIDETFFLDSLATPLVSYTYRVQAYNTYLSSAYSNEAEIVANIFDKIATNLPNISNAKLAWGDYDNDNDLDILLIGDSRTQIFSNNGNDNFTDSGITNLPILRNGEAIWKDFDKDGDLDILISGLSQTNVPQTFIYRNLGSSFEQTNNNFAGVHLAAVASADFDNDGDNDIIITGATDFAATNPISRIYFNLGNAEFDSTFLELQGVKNSAVATADIDNNGFIDIVIAGETSTGGLLTQIYDNQDSLFVPKTSNLPNLKNASLAFADYDNDDDFDILIAGQQINGNALTQVFENQNGTSWNLKRTLAGAYGGAAKWADFNNDGFADVLISGTRSNANRMTRIYINNAAANFRNSELTLPRLAQSDAAWADYDQDGDQDLLISGFNGIRNRTFLLRSIQNEFQTNEIPIAPTTLTTDTEIIDGNVFTTFEWNLGSDTQSSVSYNIFIQNANAEFLVSPQANLTTGFNRLPQFGNSQRNFSMTFKNLEGGNYQWGVQSIDAALRVSPFTTSNASISCPQVQNLALQEAVLEDCPNDGTTVKVIMEGNFEVNQVNTDVFLRWGTATNSYSNLKVLGTDIKLEPNQNSRIDIFIDTIEMFPATTYYYILETKNACGAVQQSAERVLTTPVILGENQIGNSQDIERTETFADLFDVGTLPSNIDPSNLQITWEQSRNTTDWTAITNTNGGLNLTGFAPDSTLYFRRVLTSQMCSDTSNSVLIKVFQPFVHELDSMLLVEIYNATGGENWTNSWDLTTRVRDWHGITVEDGRVVEVDLSNNNLVGELPDVFDIANQDNSITSAIRYLSFFNNRIGGTIPPTLGELFPSLEYLDLSLNIFEGEIPAELGKLIKLETLWLSHNKLEGEVLAALGNLANLRTFTLNSNKLTGLAGELGNLDKLIFFNFSDNLIAVLNDETLTMDNLQELIANNLLLKEIPAAFGNCPLLRVVEFEGNQLENLPQSMQNIALLSHLRIGANRLDFGDIEPLLGKATDLFTYSPQADLNLAYDSIVEIGQNITLRVETEGANNVYQWSLNGQDIAGANNPEYSIFYAQQEDAGVYVCRVTNSEATELILSRRPIRITVSCGSLIDAVVQSQDALTFCEGDNIFVQLKATQGEGYTYQWYKNGDAIFLANDSNFVATSAGNYWVNINSPEGCGEASNQIEITKNPAPEVTISNNGATLSFTSDTPVLAQQWLLNGEAIPNANGLTYQAKQGGRYAVIITNQTGCTAYSKEIILSVTALEDDEAELPENQLVTVYPNPTNGLLNIRIPNQLGKVQTLQLHDNLGRILLTLEVKNQHEIHTLDLQNIASGVYWLSVLTDKEHFIKKIEKQ